MMDIFLKKYLVNLLKEYISKDDTFEKPKKIFGYILSILLGIIFSFLIDYIKSFSFATFVWLKFCFMILTSIGILSIPNIVPNLIYLIREIVSGLNACAVFLIFKWKNFYEKFEEKKLLYFDAKTIKPIANLSNKDTMTLNPGNIIFDMLILLSKIMNIIVIVIMQKILLSKFF
jgi:hypothetical protein